MWVADCEYIAKLIPPNDFLEAKERVYASIISNETTTVERDFAITTFPDGMSYQTRTWRMFQLDVSDWSRAYLGLDRWSNEHWVGSHPELQPCEVFNVVEDNNPMLSYNMSDVSAETVRHLMPRLRPAPGWQDGYLAGDRRFIPWYRYEGRIQQYKALYNGQIPPNNSWFYRYWGRQQPHEQQQQQQQQ